MTDHERPEQNQSDDYILGTGDEELARLGLQHRAWRPWMLESWRRAGITMGSRVLDVGAGPGYVTVDLAEHVGPSGHVRGLERSEHFLNAAREACRIRGLRNVDLAEIDLMTDDWDAHDFDAAWCRWVACFVSSPALLVQKVARALKPGGAVIFHEYVDYGAWQFTPRRPALAEFVQEVMASWRANGGEPDVAIDLPTMLARNGMRVRHKTPIVLAPDRTELLWHWPVSFVDVNAQRLRDLGRVSDEWVARVRADLTDALGDPNTTVITPMVLEIIATRD